MSVTLGLALAVPEPWGSDLTDWRRDFGDPDADRIAPHVTILPPNTYDVVDLPMVEAGVRRACAQVEPFRLSLVGARSFRPVSEVVFIAVDEGAQDCARFEQAMRAEVPARPALHPFHPHVTVAMEVPAAVLDEALVQLADYPAAWEVTALTWYVRDPRTGVWNPEREFPLG